MRASSQYTAAARGRRTWPEAGWGLWSWEQERGQRWVPGNPLGSAGCRQEATYFFLPIAFFTHTVGSSFQALSEVSGRSHSFSAYLGWEKENPGWADGETLTSGLVDKLFPTQLGHDFYTLGEKEIMRVTLLCPSCLSCHPPAAALGGREGGGVGN